ncbi:hypothetical protein ACMXZI_18810 [Bacillus subtilis]|uniref:hypothetical protein n=1 Tax=Bacillus subtilis group TaxID=653685 RepID=UPI0005ADF25E|nr:MULTISPECIES: hypothetical protein [Bacillus subtilis group]KIN33306.1 hypothetical protein B4070_4431 [Bacillus subtilis]MCY8478033.1 hypothetical protein [Bacillus atrophaeus]MED1017870.1 hypothetical protein [Bacillus atrophaeus]MED1032496.1 hypothetical protein [Bacillus atrophaeus]MED1120965.1 hypothetical protein [Bacillus atrophaeus]
MSAKNDEVVARITKNTDDMLEELKIKFKKDGDKKFKKELTEIAVTEYYNKIFNEKTK